VSAEGYSLNRFLGGTAGDAFSTQVRIALLWCSTLIAKRCAAFKTMDCGFFIGMINTVHIV
jgi:hypothetical protein